MAAKKLDTVDRVLPNGWRISLSNELYLTHRMTSYKRLGLPLDTAIDMNPAISYQNQVLILEKAIAVAKQKISQ